MSQKPLPEPETSRQYAENMRREKEINRPQNVDPRDPIQDVLALQKRAIDSLDLVIDSMNTTQQLLKEFINKKEAATKKK